jgi:hypothetical protein
MSSVLVLLMIPRYGPFLLRPCTSQIRALSHLALLQVDRCSIFPVVILGLLPYFLAHSDSRDILTHETITIDSIEAACSTEPREMRYVPFRACTIRPLTFLTACFPLVSNALPHRRRPSAFLLLTNR